MAVVKFVKAWRRVTRHNLKQAQRHLSSLYSYNLAHAGLVPPLFSSGEASAVQAVIDLLVAKTNETKPK